MFTLRPLYLRWNFFRHPSGRTLGPHQSQSGRYVREKKFATAGDRSLVPWVFSPQHKKYSDRYAGFFLFWFHNGRNSLTSCVTIRFSRKTLHHGVTTVLAVSVNTSVGVAAVRTSHVNTETLCSLPTQCIYVPHKPHNKQRLFRQISLHWWPL